MTEAQERLVVRIRSSRQFSYADSLKRVLQYVCENASQAETPSLKEHEIATQALNRPASFDPKLDPVVRISIKQIRDRLRAYFESEGKGESLRLTIPKGQYRAQFGLPEDRPDASPVSVADAPALRKFWSAYLERGAHNEVLYTEPLFFRDEERGHYIRNLYINDHVTGLDDLKARDLELGARPLAPCYHYLSCGEVYCVFSLTRMFHELKSSLEVRNSRISFWNEVRYSNLILLGCARTNTFMDSLQGNAAFVITDDAIEVEDPHPPEHSSYRPTRYTDGKLRRCTDYALISRRPGPSPDRAVTVIASNHGKAVLGAGHFLTLDQQVAKLLGQMRVGEHDPLPKEFQVIVRVDMIDFDDEVVNVEYVAHRFPLPEGARRALRKPAQMVPPRGGRRDR